MRVFSIGIQCLEVFKQQAFLGRLSIFRSVQAMCFLSAFVQSEKYVNYSQVQCMEAFKQCAFSADVQSKKAFRQWPSSVQGFNLWGGGGCGGSSNVLLFCSRSING